MTVDVDLLDGLARLALFADFDRPHLEELLAIAEDVSFPEGEWIIRRGETDVGLYVIVDGEVSVYFEDEELAVLPRGSFFGEISTLLEEPAVADVVSRSPLRCLVIPADQVETLLLAHPRVTLRMLKTEARRLKTTDESRA